MAVVDIKKVVIFNPKGGSGKTTLSTNLASYYSSQGLKTALMDYDMQGSSTYWLSRRPEHLMSIQSIPAFKQANGMTRSFLLRLEPDVQRVIVDSPAGADVSAFRSTLSDADAILIPVLPSDIDIHAVTRSIADLLLRAKVTQRGQRIAVVANRSRTNTLIYRRLELFLHSLEIPFLTTLRDTQNYVKAAEMGIGIFEMKPYLVKPDLQTWQPLLDWLEGSRALTSDEKPAATKVTTTEDIAQNSLK